MDIAVVKEDLQDFLRDAQRIAVVGVGQRYRRDDWAGIAVVENLFLKLSGSHGLPLSLYEREFPVPDGSVRLYLGYETPENLTGKLRKFLPTHVLFVDAAQLAEEPGVLELVPISEIQGESISTHNLPLSVLGEFLEKDMGSKVMLLGIQPSSIEAGPEKSLSQSVRKAAVAAGGVIYEVLMEKYK